MSLPPFSIAEVDELLRREPPPDLPEAGCPGEPLIAPVPEGEGFAASASARIVPDPKLGIWTPTGVPARYHYPIWIDHDAHEERTHSGEPYFNPIRRALLTAGAHCGIYFSEAPFENSRLKLYVNGPNTMCEYSRSLGPFRGNRSQCSLYVVYAAGTPWAMIGDRLKDGRRPSSINVERFTNHVLGGMFGLWRYDRTANSSVAETGSAADAAFSKPIDASTRWGYGSNANDMARQFGPAYLRRTK